jgi:sugar diacid utilization regulator
VWIWLGSMLQPSTADIVRSVHEQVPARISVAIGEPRKGLEGWKLTHHEAKTALQVMWRGTDRVIRGREVVLLAAVLKDETLVRCLLDTYLGPIEELGNGDAIFETLRVFFSSGWNAAAASEALEVDRHTVSQRIRRVEKILGQSLDTCSAELQIALQIAELRKSVGHVAPFVM